MALKTDYQDYIPPATGKRYIITEDVQGYSTIQDATEYTQEGDTFGAGDINTTNAAVNDLSNGVGVWSLAGGESIPSNSDLNDYTTAGTYICPSSAVASTLENTPFTSGGSGFKLIVQYNQNANWVTQFLFVNDMIYIRYRNSSTSSFNPWKTIQTTAV